MLARVRKQKEMQKNLLLANPGASDIPHLQVWERGPCWFWVPFLVVWILLWNGLSAGGAAPAPWYL